MVACCYRIWLHCFLLLTLFNFFVYGRLQKIKEKKEGRKEGRKERDEYTFQLKTLFLGLRTIRWAGNSSWNQYKQSRLTEKRNICHLEWWWVRSRWLGTVSSFREICFGLQEVDMANRQTTRSNQVMCSQLAALWKRILSVWGVPSGGRDAFLTPMHYV